jgi:hypothetical protein
MQLANCRTDWEDNVGKDVKDRNKPRKNMLRGEGISRKHEKYLLKNYRCEISYVITMKNFLEKNNSFIANWGQAVA